MLGIHIIHGIKDNAVVADNLIKAVEPEIGQIVFYHLFLVGFD